MREEARNETIEVDKDIGMGKIRTFGMTNGIFKHSNQSILEDQDHVKKSTVEILMPAYVIGGPIRSIRVDKDRLFVLGMKNHPEVIDLTQMSHGTSLILEKIMSGNRDYTTQISMNQAAELCHVAHELKLVNLLKLVEMDMIRRPSTSMKHAVDALVLALKFGMLEAVNKLIDEIIFEFFNGLGLVGYCKSSTALEMIFDKNEMMLKEEIEVGRLNSEWNEPLPVGQEVVPSLPRGNNAQIPRIMLNVAKERIRSLVARPINSVKNGFAWISAQNLRRRGPRNHQDFPNFPD